MFDVSVGRFFQEDPLGFGPGDPNLYRYAKNSPTNYTDPSGLNPVDLNIIFEEGKGEKLTDSEFPFNGGKGKVEVFTNVGFKRADNTNGPATFIRLKFSADVSVADAHWLQIIKRDAIVDKVEKNDLYKDVIKRESAKVGRGETPGKYWRIHATLGEWTLDPGADHTPFYDLPIKGGGGHYRTKEEISIFDCPSGGEPVWGPPGKSAGRLNENIYARIQAKSYLVAKGKVYYEVSWEIKIQLIQPGFGGKLDEFKYTYTVTGKPIKSVVELPDFLKKDKLVVGVAHSTYDDETIIKPDGKTTPLGKEITVTVPNPIELKK